MFTQNVIIPIMINITIVILYYYYILLLCVIILNVISAFHIFIYSFVFNSCVILFYYAWSTPHLNLLQVLLVTTSLCIYVLPIAPIKKEIM